MKTIEIICYRLYLILTLFLLSQNTSFGQNTQVAFYEIIKDDSIRMFFNQRNNFTEKECSDFIRYIKLDTMADYNGYFEDVSNENKLLGKGTYQHGKKNGYFEVYYPEGNIQCKGNYKNNLPVGQWEFFHENGLRDRTIMFTETDTLLINSYDEKQRLKVSEGNGKFNDYVGGITGSCYNEILAKGKIVNGKPEGLWTSVYSEQPYCAEKYINGKLKRGEFPQAISNKDRYYKQVPMLNSFFLKNYLFCLENFTVESCSDSAGTVEVSYINGKQEFQSELRKSIETVMYYDVRSRNIRHCVYGDNHVSVKFSVSKNGKPYNVNQVSLWGQQFTRWIDARLKEETTFPSDCNKELYFHLTIHFNSANNWQYYFKFSKNMSLK